MPIPRVPQTLLGERLLARQLSAMGVLPKRSASLADTPEAQAALQALWKAHGDAISRNYAGTGALRKSSLRRRLLLDPAISLARCVVDPSPTMSGEENAAAVASPVCTPTMMRSHTNECRYYLNNHGDGLRADAAAFVSGAHVPCAGTISLFPEGVLGNVVSRARRLPSIQVRCVLRLLLRALTPHAGGFFWYQLPVHANAYTGCYHCLWMAVCAGCVASSPLSRATGGACRGGCVCGGRARLGCARSVIWLIVPSAHHDLAFLSTNILRYRYRLLNVSFYPSAGCLAAALLQVLKRFGASFVDRPLLLRGGAGAGRSTSKK